MIVKDILYYIWLAQSFPFGSGLPAAIIEYYNGDIYKFYENIESESKKFNITQNRKEKLRSKKIEDFEIIVNLCKKLNIKMVCHKDVQYPTRLRKIKSAPAVLYYVGNIKVLNSHCVAVVGTRNCDENGISTSNQLSKKLAEYGITAISGCAKGIDAAVHKSILNANGNTVAVLGTPLDVNYPIENRSLKVDIVKKGGLIFSEYPPKTKVTQWLFPIRNRLISGLSDAVVIVQAPKKSGAIITARYAKKQNRKLFCVPPANIFSSDAFGVKECKDLGASLLFGIEDILDFYKSKNCKLEKNKSAAIKDSDDILKNVPEQLRELFIIVNKEKRLEDILKQTKYPAGRALSMLSQLEIYNLLERTKTGYKRVVS